MLAVFCSVLFSVLGLVSFGFVAAASPAAGTNRKAQSFQKHIACLMLVLLLVFLTLEVNPRVLPPS